MIHEVLAEWLDSLDLSLDAMVLANLALGLARSFDEQANTSTAAELRKTVLEIRRLVAEGQKTFDPLDELLTRGVNVPAAD